MFQKQTLKSNSADVNLPEVSLNPPLTLFITMGVNYCGPSFVNESWNDSWCHYHGKQGIIVSVILNASLYLNDMIIMTIIRVR